MLFISIDLSFDIIIFHVYSIYSILLLFIDDFSHRYEKNLSKQRLLKVLIGRRVMKNVKLNSLHKVA